MKFSIVILSHLCSLSASKPDARINKLRNKLIRDIDGTAIPIGPEGATARFSLSMGLDEEPVTTSSPGSIISDAGQDQLGFHEADDELFHEEVGSMLEVEGTTLATAESVTTSSWAVMMEEDGGETEIVTDGGEDDEGDEEVNDDVVVHDGSLVDDSGEEVITTVAAKTSKRDHHPLAKGEKHDMSITSKTSKSNHHNHHHHHQQQQQHESMSVSLKAAKVHTAGKTHKTNDHHSMSLLSKTSKADSKADKSPVVEEIMSISPKAHKEVSSMPNHAPKTLKEQASLSMNSGGKAEKSSFSMEDGWGGTKVHSRLFSVRKRSNSNGRRLDESSVSYSMSMRGEDDMSLHHEIEEDFTDTEYTVETIAITDEPVTTIPAIELISEDTLDSSGDDTIRETPMLSMNIQAKASKTTHANDPMAKAIKEHSLSISPKASKSTSPKAEKAKAEKVMSVNPKSVKLAEHSLSMKGSKSEKDVREHSLSMKSKNASKHRLFDNRRRTID